MRSIRRSDRGLSEIVGTLMLIVIVVSAATLLAAFVASYQKQLQSEEASVHNKTLEDLTIVSVLPTVNPGVNYTAISLVVGSLDPQSTAVTEITLNGDPVAEYNVTALGSTTHTEVCDVCNASLGIPTFFGLGTLQQFTVAFNTQTFTSTDSTGGLALPYDLTINHFITISLFTQLGNQFTRSFIAPTPVELITQTSIYVGGTEDEAVVVLNGENSINPANATIAQWAWTVTPLTLNLTQNYAFPLVGAEELIPQSLFPTCANGTPNFDASWCPQSYNITLTVEDSDELFGETSVPYLGYPET